jgi:hypothetical protein
MTASTANRGTVAYGNVRWSFSLEYQNRWLKTAFRSNKKMYQQPVLQLPPTLTP